MNEILMNLAWVMVLAVLGYLALRKVPDTKIRSMIVVRPGGKEMDRAEQHRALSQMTDEHPVWVAVNQIIAEQLDNAVSQVSSPEMAMEPGALAHTAGGIEWLRALQTALHDAKEGRETAVITPYRRLAMRDASGGQDLQD